MSSDLGVLGNRADSTLHSQCGVKTSLLGITPERGQQKWEPVLRKAIWLAQIAYTYLGPRDKMKKGRD